MTQPSAKWGLYAALAAGVLALARVFTHEQVCAQRWNDVRGDLARGELRMGRLERLGWATVTAVIGLLLTVLGFLLTHPYQPPFAG